MNEVVALTWHPKETVGIHWYIRGIKPDGSFYGEARSPRVTVNVEGEVPPGDWARCSTILNKIATGPPIQLDETWAGRIARWRTSLCDCEVVYGYAHGDEKLFEWGAQFLELKVLLEKQISRFYSTMV